MYFGKTHNERRRAEGLFGKSLWLAWRPVRLEDGRWCWLDYVWRKWCCDKLAPVNCGWQYTDYHS